MASHSRRRGRRPKTISNQGLTGQQGVNFIEHVVLDAGSRWTASGPNEIGIDGYIEIFDPISREPLGLTLAVQSKVVSAIGNNSGLSFDYWCDADDLEYWLNGNIPLILIVSSPATREGYWISTRDYFTNWKRGDQTRVTFIKSLHRFSKETFHLLAQVAVPQSGLYLAPTRCKEVLHTNLLTLETFPSSVYVAGTDHRTPSDIRAALRETKREIDGVWVLWEKKIVSFHDLAAEPWSSLCDTGTREEFAATEWSTSNDPARKRIFVQLLNQTLRDQTSAKLRYWPQEDCYAIAGRPRKLSYQSLKRRSKITVVS